MTPLLIAIEGLDGAGKSTFALALQRALPQSVRSAVVHTPGARLKALAFDVRNSNSDASFLAFMIGNVDAVQNVQQHDVIIVDRYVVSTVVHHQDTCRRWRPALVALMESMSAVFPVMTVFLDVQVDIAAARLGARADAAPLLVDLATQRRRYLENLQGALDQRLTGHIMTFPHDGPADTPHAITDIQAALTRHLADRGAAMVLT